MNAIQQFAQELDALRRDFAQYRVETALRLDALERRVDYAEGALLSADFPPLRAVPAPAPAPAPSRSYDPAMPGSGEHRQHLRAPLPVITAPAPDLSPNVQTRAHPPTPYGYSEQPPRSAARPAKKLGSRQNAQYLPFAMEKIAAAWQKKGAGDKRTWQVPSWHSPFVPD